MKIVSWNVNGIRAWIKKWTFFEYLEKYSPDIIGLQEVKANIEQVEKKDIEKIKELWYEIYWNSAQRAWYSGTAVLTKIIPISVNYWIQSAELDLEWIETDDVIDLDYEWRVITLEFENFFYTTVYTPNSKQELERLDYRKIWDEVFLKYQKHLESQKPVIFCWDLNVAHNEIDLANPKANMTTDKKPWNAWFTNTERKGFQNIIDEWFIDTFRALNPDKTWCYSRWSNFWKAREKNVWWRIDYVVVSNSLISKLKDAFINPEVMWSDHCPVWIELK